MCKKIIFETMFRFKRNERFYHVYLQHNFFDGITVVCVWGTFDSKNGGSKMIFCDNMNAVQNVIDEIKKIRLKRSYIPY